MFAELSDVRTARSLVRQPVLHVHARALYDHASMLRVGIIGASGYTGAELLRLCAQHPEFERRLRHRRQPGRAPRRRRCTPAWPGAIRTSCSRRSTSPAPPSSTSCSSVCRTRRAWRWRPQLVGQVRCVVDLSAAYRLKDASLYPGWYGFEHDQPELLAQAVFGLPELHRSELKEAAARRHARAVTSRRRRSPWPRSCRPG